MTEAPRNQKERCFAVVVIIWLAATVILWIAYGVSLDSCNYKLDAKIVDTRLHPRYAGRCMVTLQWNCPKSGCEDTFSLVDTFPSYFCQVLKQDGSQQSVGKYIQGCVRGNDLDKFHPQYEASEDSDDDLDGEYDDDEGFTSAHTVYSLFVAGMVITFVGLAIVVAACFWCMAAQPRSTVPTPSSSSTSPPVARPCSPRPQQPAQEMANTNTNTTSYPPIPPAQGAPEKSNHDANLRL